MVSLIAWILKQYGLFLGVAEPALREAPNCDSEGCEVFGTEVYDGLHVSWGSEHFSRPIRNVFESSRVAANKRFIG